MRERNSFSKIESSDISKTSAPQGATESSEQERLPRGSALDLETILKLAREIQVTGELEDAKHMAGTIAEYAGDLIERYNRQMKIAA